MEASLPGDALGEEGQAGRRGGIAPLEGTLTIAAGSNAAGNDEEDEELGDSVSSNLGEHERQCLQACSRTRSMKKKHTLKKNKQGSTQKAKTATNAVWKKAASVDMCGCTLRKEGWSNCKRHKSEPQCKGKQGFCKVGSTTNMLE